MMVQQRMSPKTRCVSAISHQPSSIQRTLNTTCKQPVSLPALGWRSCPKGHSESEPILKSCTPKGIPMMVRHMIRPAVQYMSAVSSPPMISQTRFPRKFIVVCIMFAAAKVVKIFGLCKKMYEN